MKVRWTRQALADLEDSLDWIAEENPAAADAVGEQIRTAISHLAAYPKIGRSGRVSGTRELVVPETPYIMAYRETSRNVEVLAVLHSRRRWPDRL